MEEQEHPVCKPTRIFSHDVRRASAHARNNQCSDCALGALTVLFAGRRTHARGGNAETRAARPRRNQQRFWTIIEAIGENPEKSRTRTRKTPAPCRVFDRWSDLLHPEKQPLLRVADLERARVCRRVNEAAITQRISASRSCIIESAPRLPSSARCSLHSSPAPKSQPHRPGPIPIYPSKGKIACAPRIHRPT